MGFFVSSLRVHLSLDTGFCSCANLRFIIRKYSQSRGASKGSKGAFPVPQAVIVSAVRTPVGRAPKGALSTTRPDDLGALAVGGALDKVPDLNRAEIDDVILGCAQPQDQQGGNVARWVILRAGLPVEVPGITVNR